MRAYLARHRYGFTLAALLAAQLAIVAAALLLTGLDMAQQQRRQLYDAIAGQAGMLAALAAMLLLLLGLLLKRIFDTWLTPLSRLEEEAAMLLSHPGRRIAAAGAPAVRRLAERINALAERAHQTQQEDQARIASALGALAQERNRLAALMADLALGVLVCNAEGRILLYNGRASALLDNGAGTAPGLGRSVFGIIDRGLLVHALEQLQHQLLDQDDAAAATPDRPRSLPLAPLVATMPGGRMLRMQMAPVLDEAHAMAGFVLTADDISAQVQSQDRLALLLDSLVQQARAGLANIRAAAETLGAYPEMEAARRVRFVAVIEQESQSLTAALDEVAQRRDQDAGRHWQLEEMRGADLLGLLQRRLASRSLQVATRTVSLPELWFNIDGFALSQALAGFAARIAAECGGGVELRLGSEGRMAWLELAWPGQTPSPGQLRQWEQAAECGASLETVVTRHGGQTMLLTEPAGTRWRLLLPTVPPRAALPARTGPSRPEFYDFDLFQQPGQNAALDAMRLDRLSYTVFDTETTGLDPAGGDEIISIGALRIVNARLLPQENFERLVRPRRPVSAASLGVHGISDAMLRDQPGILEVLPQFHRFVEDTVLVAHNAAFDMRFLRMREGEAGVAFGQPVLDTLLLSQALHPNQAEHSLEALAARLGVAVVGRHTALGDAIVTAEVFLRMLPLLQQAGVTTLGEAREASQRTRYARLRY